MHKLLLSMILLISSLSSAELILTGTVISNNQKMIGPRYMGYVKKINFEIGDQVKREDVLFELESAEFDIMKNQADLALEQAKLMVEVYQEKLNFGNKNKNFNSPVGDVNMNMGQMNDVTQNVSASLSSAQVLVKQASEKTKQFATITGFLKIIAPNDGILVEKRIRVGDMVAPGMLAMVLVDLDNLEIEAEVAESDLKYLRRNKSVKVSIPSFNYRASGYIKAIVPSANPMSHTFKIRVHFEKTSKRIFPGMYAKVFLDLTNEYEKD